jgi:hypothetical protein
MNVKELIEALSNCNPEFPVFFAIDGRTAIAVNSCEFRSYDETGDPDTVYFAFSGKHQCVMLFEQPTDIAD